MASPSQPEDRTEPPPGWTRYTVTDDDGAQGVSLYVRPDVTVATVEEAWAIEDRKRAVGSARREQDLLRKIDKLRAYMMRRANAAEADGKMEDFAEWIDRGIGLTNLIAYLAGVFVIEEPPTPEDRS